MNNRNKDPKQTPMMRQYFEIKSRHPDKYLFFRLGDFYEMFDQDAIEVSSILQITLTERHQIPMCGIPHHQLHRYAHKVIAQGKKVVIVEQEKPAPGSTLFTRKIAQIITPGTTIDEMNLTAQEKNFIVSFHFSEERLLDQVEPAGLTALETTTGEVVFEHVPDVQNLERALNRFFENYTPAELVLPESYRENQLTAKLMKSYPHLIVNHLPAPAPDQVKDKIRSIYPSRQATEAVGLSYQSLYLLISYAEENYGEKITYLQPPREVEPSHILTLDQQTLIHLEIFKNNFDHTQKHSLLSVIDYTRTAMGSRKLQENLALPSRNLGVIEKRLEQVNFLFQNPFLLKEIRGWMSKICDIERVSSRLALKKILPRDFNSLKHSLTLTQKLLTTLAEKKSAWIEKIFDSEKKNVSDLVTTLGEIVEKLEKTFIENPGNDITKGDCIRPGAHPRLQEYHHIRTQAEGLLSELEFREKSNTGIATLKIRYNDNLGYFFEVGKSSSAKVPERFLRKQSLVSAERFVNEELLQLDSQIREARDNSLVLEREIFEETQREVAKHIPLLQRISHFIAEVDVAAGFAELASVCRWCRPVMMESGALEIRGGRHPVVESEISDPFIPNDLSIGNQDDIIQIITGPNMSGKSTFLRQNALIVILAHVGSFVPADSAHIPLCDQVFTRIGSGDRLFQGESTFLVEMQETAHILNQMTPQSLVIMDEIGRGTSTYDGLALAWSILEYTNRNPDKRAKTLFATHYHELISLTQEEGITHYHVTIREEGDQIVFLKKVIKGVTSRSYGIQVARLAGLPEEVVVYAQNLLRELEKKQEQVNPDGIGNLLSSHQSQTPDHSDSDKHSGECLSLWKESIEAILDFDVASHSPLETSQFLHDLQQKVRKKSHE